MGHTYSYWAVHPFRRPDPKPWLPVKEIANRIREKKAIGRETGDTLIFLFFATAAECKLA
jgi:hypothetical protein